MIVTSPKLSITSIQNTLPTTRREAKRIMLESENYCLINKVLFKLEHSPRDEDIKLLICVPDSLVNNLLYRLHDAQSHFSVNKLFKTIASQYFFPKMYSRISEWVNSCIPCQIGGREHDAKGTNSGKRKSIATTKRSTASTWISCT